MKKILLSIISFTVCFSSFALEYPSHVMSWVENNVINIEFLEEEEKQPIYHIVNAFYSRLANWHNYKPFYDRLYQDSENAKKYPVFIDISEGLYIVILRHFQRLTDLPPYQTLRGKTIEQVFGYSGEVLEQLFGRSEILMDEAGGEATRQTLIIQKKALSKCVMGNYNVFYHEFAHLLHLTLLLEEEFWYLEELYKSATEKDRYLDDYAASNSAEYFATGLEAYFSVSKPSNYHILDYHIHFKHTRKDLEEKDPKLLAFIESLIDDKISLKDFEMPCYLSDGNTFSDEDYNLEDPLLEAPLLVDEDPLLEAPFLVDEDPLLEAPFLVDEDPLLEAPLPANGGKIIILSR